MGDSKLAIKPALKMAASYRPSKQLHDNFVCIICFLRSALEIMQPNQPSFSFSKRNFQESSCQTLPYSQLKQWNFVIFMVLTTLGVAKLHTSNNAITWSHSACSSYFIQIFAWDLTNMIYGSHAFIFFWLLINPLTLVCNVTCLVEVNPRMVTFQAHGYFNQCTCNDIIMYSYVFC